MPGPATEIGMSVPVVIVVSTMAWLYRIAVDESNQNVTLGTATLALTLDV